MRSFLWKKALLSTLFGLFLLAVPLLIMALPTAASAPESAAPTIVTVNSGTVTEGETFTAAITFTIPPPNMLQAVTLDIAYDPTILGYTDGSCTVNSPFLGFCNRSESDGLPPDVISFSVIAIPAVGGTVSIGEIPFIANNLGTSDLTITVRTIDDGSIETPTTVDGSVTVEEVPTAVTTNQLSTTATLNTETGIILLALLAVAALTAVTIIRRKAAG